MQGSGLLADLLDKPGKVPFSNPAGMLVGRFSILCACQRGSLNPLSPEASSSSMPPKPRRDGSVAALANLGSPIVSIVVPCLGSSDPNYKMVETVGRLWAWVVGFRAFGL